MPSLRLGMLLGIAWQRLPSIPWCRHLRTSMPVDLIRKRRWSSAWCFQVSWPRPWGKTTQAPDRWNAVLITRRSVSSRACGLDAESSFSHAAWQSFSGSVNAYPSQSCVGSLLLAGPIEALGHDQVGHHLLAAIELEETEHGLVVFKDPTHARRRTAQRQSCVDQMTEHGDACHQ